MSVKNNLSFVLVSKYTLIRMQAGPAFKLDDQTRSSPGYHSILTECLGQVIHCHRIIVTVAIFLSYVAVVTLIMLLKMHKMCIEFRKYMDF